MKCLKISVAAALRGIGLSVLLFHYRGYGRNPGTPSRGRVADARATRAYVASRPDVDADRLVYFGESLGAAVAVALSADQPPAALVLRSPFTSLGDMGRRYYPFLPVHVLVRDRFRFATTNSLRHVSSAGAHVGPAAPPGPERPRPRRAPDVAARP